MPSSARGLYFGSGLQKALFAWWNRRGRTRRGKARTRVHDTAHNVTLHNIPRNILRVGLLWPYNLLDELDISMNVWTVPPSCPLSYSRKRLCPSDKVKEGPSATLGDKKISPPSLTLLKKSNWGEGEETLLNQRWKIPAVAYALDADNHLFYICLRVPRILPLLFTRYSISEIISCCIWVRMTPHCLFSLIDETSEALQKAFRRKFW